MKPSKLGRKKNDDLNANERKKRMKIRFATLSVQNGFKPAFIRFNLLYIR